MLESVDLFRFGKVRSQCLKITQNVAFLDLEFDIYFFIFRYTVFHGASKMLQELQSSGGMKDSTFVVVFV